jgi:hypothetical protein
MGQGKAAVQPLEVLRLAAVLIGGFVFAFAFLFLFNRWGVLNPALDLSAAANPSSLAVTLVGRFLCATWITRRRPCRHSLGLALF